jgi:Subtilase family
MPDLPALPLGAPQVRTRSTRRSPRPRLVGPGAAAQQSRLGPELVRLTQAFEAGRLRVPDQPAALAPEQVLVLEVAGELKDFMRAVRRVPGLEFLAEEAQDQLEPDEEFAAVDRHGRRHRYVRQLFLMASDATAWQQLLGLWQRFQREEDFPHGLTGFRDLFGRLRSLRPWNDEDRLERTGALAAWERELGDLGDELVDFEIELWLRRDGLRRVQALAELRADLETVGGELVAEFVHEEIGYHGVLGRAPGRLLLDAVDHHEMRWMRTGYVRFFRATGQIAAVVPEEEATAVGAEDRGPRPEGAPRIALLDGVPLAAHTLLADRLVIDDPDGFEALTPASRRLHGTAMASIIVHGDLDSGAVVHTRRVYVRPILSAQAPDWVRDAREELPRDRLPVDLVHAAVTRLYEGEAVAPDVKVIVLAIGDAVAQFDRFVSPLARLLDWLSFRYGVLFIVSAGNHLDDLELAADTALHDPHELEHEVLCALQRTAALRGLLSPAEAVNALTIGAAHADSSNALSADDRLDPLAEPTLASVVSALGPGIRRAVKPDLLLPGGRQLVRLEPARDSEPQCVSIPPSRRPPGVRFASPSTRAGLLDVTAYGTGTSMAAALAGHHAGHLLDALDALRNMYGQAIPTAQLDAVLLKAALVHQARWGPARKLVEEAQEEVLGQSSREGVARLVGYGHVQPTRALVCDEHRVTALAAGRIADGVADAYRLPLPPSLASTTAERRLTLTLAWLTPINPEHRAYRRAALTLEPSDGPKLAVDRSDLTTYPSRRGTLQHEMLTGSRAVPFAPGSALELTVSCRADAGPLTVPVPYAVIATLEVPEQLHLPIYEEVRQALRVPVAVRRGAAP